MLSQQQRVQQLIEYNGQLIVLSGPSVTGMSVVLGKAKYSMCGMHRQSG